MFVYPPKPAIWPALGLFNLSFFLYHRKKKKMKQILNTLVNVQIIYIIHTVITCQSFPTDNLFAADLSTG